MDSRIRIENFWLWGGALIVILLIGLFDPSQFGFFPRCPFYWLTGWQCPGCGSQRALHHLLHLEIGQAFVQNPLLLIGIPYILTGFVFDYVDSGSERWMRWRRILFGRRAIIFVSFVVLGWWILRNVY